MIVTVICKFIASVWCKHQGKYKASFNINFMLNKYMSSLYFDDKYVTCKIKTDLWFWKKWMLDKLWVLIYLLYHHVAVK